MTTTVFSPHTDDAIFSIGAHITGLKARIVTPFAGIPDDEAGRQKHTTLRAEHQPRALINRLIAAGFRTARLSHYRDPLSEAAELDDREHECFFVEAVK